TTLATLLATGALAFGVYGPTAVEGHSAIRSLPRRHPRGRSGAVISASAVALSAWLLAGSERLVESRLALLLCLAVFGVAAIHAARWAVATWRHGPARRRWWLLLPATAALGALVSADRVATALAWLALALALVVGLLLAWQRSFASALARLTERPATALVATFAFLGLAGGLLLALPPVSAHPARLPFLDALFTATSASCVTGLVVLDTPSDFSGLGQAVILLLIQVGGLGIMTFSAAGTLLLGRRIGLQAEAALAGILADASRADLVTALRRVLLVTAIAEILGAVVLTTAFAVGGEPLSSAGWRGLFTAVSAFCNAGFSLQSNSLVPYQQEPVVLHTVAALVVLGGLGPSVIVALPSLVRHRHVPLHVRLVVATTAVLLAAGTLLFLLTEWTGVLAPLPMEDRFHNAWFQAVTPRTAGFDAIDMVATKPITQVFTMLLMFVGGSPGSAAGGVKTTTVALLFLAVLAALRGRTSARAFGRTADPRSVTQAMVVATLGVATAFLGFVVLVLTQPLPAGALAFETISALGTVGLSLGVTPSLDAVGRIVVIGLMFVGRVGPLTLFLFLSGVTRRRSADPPVESVHVG
ncbi:MAG: hypothetical protein JXB39_10175, partial [Deltaproteobacteria bacterium]|nr:hypothetical protein [Deltaproteobacteria bacterium]